VAAVALVVGYVVVRFNYSRIPPLPRLAGIVAAVVGVAEAAFGWTLRTRIRESTRTRGADDRAPADPGRRPVPALTAARALLAAKATALAGAAVGGLWLGVLAVVWPQAGQVLAASADRTTALIGVVGAAVMTAGALVLERCLRTPDDPPGAPRTTDPR
jgi:hypothetical protein